VKTLEISPERHAGDLLSTIGETLRAERNERGLTLKQVAEGAHVSVSYLAEIERGEKDPSSRVLESIASGLDVEVSELLVRIEACGVCPTDARKFAIGVNDGQYPFNPGHEWVGRVAAVGGEVTGWELGARVYGDTYAGYAEYATIAAHPGDWSRGALAVGELPVERAVFVEPLADCLIADGIQVAQLHHLAGQKPKRPAASARRWVAASQCHQLSLDVAGYLGRGTGAGLIIQGGLHAL